jgi:hypothetical protein
MSERPANPEMRLAPQAQGEPFAESDLLSRQPEIDQADHPAHRLRLDWTRLKNGGQPALNGQISQSLTGGREKTVTVEVKRRRPNRG